MTERLRRGTTVRAYVRTESGRVHSTIVGRVITVDRDRVEVAYHGTPSPNQQLEFNGEAA